MIGGLPVSCQRGLDDQMLRIAGDPRVQGVVVRLESLAGQLLYARALGEDAIGAALTDVSAFRHEELGEPLLAILMVLLDGEGLIGRRGLDTPVTEVEARLGLAVGSSSGQAVTLRHLLNHTSALPDTHDGVRAPAPSPGRRYRRFPAGYVRLRRIAERLAGDALDALLTDRVLAPLGMDETTLDAIGGFDATLGATTTARDLSRLLSGLAANRLAGRPRILRQLTAWKAVSDLPRPALAVGLGLFQMAQPVGELWGRADADGAQMAYDPACRISLSGKVISSSPSVDWSWPLMRIIRPQPEHFLGL